VYNRRGTFEYALPCAQVYGRVGALVRPAISLARHFEAEGQRAEEWLHPAVNGKGPNHHAYLS